MRKSLEPISAVPPRINKILDPSEQQKLPKLDIRRIAMKNLEQKDIILKQPSSLCNVGSENGGHA
jgi:hypothetical protein